MAIMDRTWKRTSAPPLPLTTTGRDSCVAPVKPGETQSHALNATVPSGNKDAEQERPPASACAGCAGARTPSQTGPDGSRACASAAHGSEDKTEMGNKHARDAGNHSRSVGISEPDLGSEVGGSVPKVREEDTGRGSGEGAGAGGAGSGRSDSASNSPKGSRKSFIRHMMSSSPQVRRSVALRHGRHAAKSDSDASSVNSAHGEEESGGAATLDPVEHEWMMCACDGEWDSLRRLLNREPGLISKRDFVTGFTCLHWAAKLGKHELLAQILTFARQRGVALDVNVRSGAGYTPLHLAAMHNHIEVIKLLVGACDADVDVRDYSGKKASQYLRGDVARDVLDIAGAEAACDPGSDEHALGDEAARWKLPRVLQANLRLLNRSASEDDDRDFVAGLARDRPLRRKSSFTKLKPRLSKVRAGVTPIVHSTSHFERLEGATGQTSGPVRTRPTSNLFG